MTSPSSRLPLLLLLCVAQLMVILDISAVNVALPDMAVDLGIDPSDIGWAITSYSLVFGSLLLLGGRAADLLGRRRMFLVGPSLFTVASLALQSPATRRRCLSPAPGSDWVPRCCPRGAVDHHVVLRRS